MTTHQHNGLDKQHDWDCNELENWRESPESCVVRLEDDLNEILNK